MLSCDSADDWHHFLTTETPSDASFCTDCYTSWPHTTGRRTEKKMSKQERNAAKVSGCAGMMNAWVSLRGRQRCLSFFALFPPPLFSLRACADTQSSTNKNSTLPWHHWKTGGARGAARGLTLLQWHVKTFPIMCGHATVEHTMFPCMLVNLHIHCLWCLSFYLVHKLPPVCRLLVRFPLWGRSVLVKPATQMRQNNVGKENYKSKNTSPSRWNTFLFFAEQLNKIYDRLI